MPAISPDGKLVAVTGASGFIGSHCVSALLAAGFKVRAIVRDPTNPAKTAHLTKLRDEIESDRLEFGRGDLLEDGSFDEALRGCSALVHTAAIVQTNNADAQRTIVDPSVKGTENVLSSVKRAGGVKRIVHTSSVAAVYNLGPEQLAAIERGEPFDETSFNTWSSVSNGDACVGSACYLNFFRVVRRTARWEQRACPSTCNARMRMAQVRLRQSASGADRSPVCRRNRWGRCCMHQSCGGHRAVHD